MDINEYIKKLTKYYLEEHSLKSDKDINYGHCVEFAEDLERYFPAGAVLGFTDIFDEDDTQDWIKDDNGNILFHKYSQSNHSFTKNQLINMPYHVWFYYNDKHYDSECPKGVSDFLDLPFYKRIIDNLS